MDHVPSWVMKIVSTKDLCCNKCKKVVGENELISVGIQISSVSPYNEKLCIGFHCPQCKEITIFELNDMSLLQFAYEVLDRETESKKIKLTGNIEDYQQNEKQENVHETKQRKDAPSCKSKTLEKSKITKKEINDIVRFLENSDDHEDLLVSMGMSPEQVLQYRYKKPKGEDGK